MIKRIYLIGYMGCGKSTVGRLLAKTLQWNFIDMDSYIEERYRKSISDIFKRDGEDSFRKKERFILEELSGEENTVISTGGGASCFFDNINVMNTTGLTVYLNLTPEALAERLYRTKTSRPLIKDMTDSELINHIRQHLNTRLSFYEQAEVIINDSRGTPESVTAKVFNAIKSRIAE